MNLIERTFDIVARAAEIDADQSEADLWRKIDAQGEQVKALESGLYGIARLEGEINRVYCAIERKKERMRRDLANPGAPDAD